MHHVIVNVFRVGKDWFGAVWVDGEHDTQIDLDASSPDEAIEEAESHYPGAAVRLID